MSKFTERLSQPGIFIADGATGTELLKAGLPRGMAPERWNLENPQGVRALHRSYLEAGSNVILTNTFGGTVYRLERDGLKDQVREVNRRAAELARLEAEATDALVFGDIGPSGKLLKPYGPLTYSDAVQAFAEQAAGLVDGQVDAILIETMSDLNELKAALEGVRLMTPDLPVLATMSFEAHGRTMMGVKPEDAARELSGLSVTVMGANCGRTLSETLEAIQKMRQAAPETILMAKPNAGLPHMEGGESVYDVTPEVMGEYALKFAQEKVKIFGGCCGSTPEHIRGIALALKEAGLSQ